MNVYKALAAGANMQRLQEGLAAGRWSPFLFITCCLRSETCQPDGEDRFQRSQSNLNRARADTKLRRDGCNATLKKELRLCRQQAAPKQLEAGIGANKLGQNPGH